MIAARRRGEPALALLAVLGSWVVARAVALAPPAEAPAPEAVTLAAAPAPAPAFVPSHQRWVGQQPSVPAASLTLEYTPRVPAILSTASPMFPAAPRVQVERPARRLVRQLVEAPSAADLGPRVSAPAGFGAGVPPVIPAMLPLLPTGQTTPRKRWSVDTWVLARPGSLAAGSALPRLGAYGASQAGIAGHYRLAPGDPRRPSLEARFSGSLGTPRQREAAVGVSARPLAALPLRLQGEVRLAQDSGARDWRPAAFAVTELPALHLPGGFTGEAYAAAGYVGGRAATAFVDGQARVDRTIVQGKAGHLALGIGAWGGAQRDVARLDAGPSAAFHTKVAGVPVRVVADYRVRLAGGAAPGSGPTLTLSTGF